MDSGTVSATSSADRQCPQPNCLPRAGTCRQCPALYCPLCRRQNLEQLVAQPATTAEVVPAGTAPFDMARLEQEERKR